MRFRETLTGLRAAMHEEGARSVCPGLAEMIERERRVRNHQLRWAVAAALVTVMLAAIPFYQQQQRKREAERERADSLLFGEINEGLSRSVAPALAPLLGIDTGN